MGFRTGAYATIWEVQPHSDVRTSCRMTISHKSKQTGQYENDFSGYASFLGTAAAQKAAKLKERDKIKLGDVDATVIYNKDKQVTYHNYNVFSFETEDEFNAENNQTQNATPDEPVEGEVSEERLPF